jgi:drug/metabolite transporter (DMT)-like permease
MKSASNPLLAAILTLCASAFAAGSTFMAKAVGSGTLGPALHPLQVSQGRFLFAFIAISTLAVIIRPKLTKPNLKLHVGRSIFGWGGVTLMFAAAIYIPLSDATAISFLNPVFAMLFAIPLLGEKVGPWRWLAAIISLIGAVILLRPGAESIQTGALFALGAAVVLGVEVIMIKFLTKTDGPFQILLINNTIGIVISTIAAIPFWIWPSTLQWVGLAGVGLLMMCAQALFTNAVMRAEASFVAPFFYATLVFAAFYDAAIFGVIPDVVSIFGALTVLAGAGLLAWREAMRKGV